MFEENEDLVLEGTENVEEQATEELVDGAKVEEEEEQAEVEQEQEAEATEEESTEPKPRLYTEEELTNIVNKRVGRATSKLRKQLEEEHANELELANIAMQGMGIEDSSEAVDSMRTYYQSKNIKIKPRQTYRSQEEETYLAERYADQTIEDGLDAVNSELERLASKGVENMTSIEKQTFSRLNDHRKSESRKKELRAIGVKDEVINSKEFTDYASQFKEDVPIARVYEQYTKSIDKPHIEKMGSMKNPTNKEVKTYYSPEDVDKLTAEDYDNPTIMKYVRESMTKWKNKK